MPIHESDLHQLTRTVWATVLGEEAVSDPEGDCPPLTDPATGYAEITGAWQGTVLLRCPAALVRRAACSMFQVGAECLTTEQVEDTLAELTNITAGNVKSLLEQPSFLSLPVVASEEECVRQLAGHRPIAQIQTTAADLPLQVVVFERGAAPGPGSGSQLDLFCDR